MHLASVSSSISGYNMESSVSTVSTAPVYALIVRSYGGHDMPAEDTHATTRTLLSAWDQSIGTINMGDGLGQVPGYQFLASHRSHQTRPSLGGGAALLQHITNTCSCRTARMRLQSTVDNLNDKSAPPSTSTPCSIIVHDGRTACFGSLSLLGRHGDEREAQTQCCYQLSVQMSTDNCLGLRPRIPPWHLHRNVGCSR
ncbi:hypothetical protein IF1G_04883 [Cordyceps javanica]|uniref:Uncharacterized protein n=1 Tax=Cordyceps javanica TaxID=43265 RepID=A0A545V3L7_9HYPO|nr:hypothetical protein IF1G_04883 [Cordyceps javanica]